MPRRIKTVLFVCLKTAALKYCTSTRPPPGGQGGLWPEHSRVSTDQELNRILTAPCVAFAAAAHTACLRRRDRLPLPRSLQVQAGAGGKKLKVARVTVVRQAALLDGLPPGSERRGLRVGVLGHAGAGKSTLVSVLTRGLSDNGRGLARMQVFRHNHEVFNGRTSSISQQGEWGGAVVGGFS